MNSWEALWPVEALPGARRRPSPHRRGFRLRPPWDWNWRRIGERIGLPLLFVLAWVIVGWGGQP